MEHHIIRFLDGREVQRHTYAGEETASDVYRGWIEYALRDLFRGSVTDANVQWRTYASPNAARGELVSGWTGCRLPNGNVHVVERIGSDRTRRVHMSA